MDSVLKKSVIFYAGTILFSWTLWIGAMVISGQIGVEILYNEGFYTALTEGVESLQQLLLSLFFTAAVYSPLVGVFAVGLVMKDRKDGLAAMPAGKTRQKNIAGWLLFILLYPVLLFSSALLVTWVMMGFTGEFNWGVLPLWFTPLFFLFQFVTSGMEEFGWRGFLQPLLQKRMTAEKACFRVGVLWIIWHYPFIIYLNYPSGTITVLLTSRRLMFSAGFIIAPAMSGCASHCTPGPIQLLPICSPRRLIRC